MTSTRHLLFVGMFFWVTLGLCGSEVRYAKNFTVETHEEFTLVTVKNAYKGAGDRVFQYVLLSSGQKAPEAYSHAMVVNIPVKRAIVLSTTFLGPIDQLGVVDSLIGIGSFKYTNTTRVIEKIERGELEEVGSESSKNLELIVSLEPDIVFTNAIGNPEYDIHPVLNQMDIPSALTAAYLEETSLGRAEWIKFVAAFYDKLDLAEELFTKVESEYDRLKALTANVTTRPTVFTNAPWGNVWYTPSGLSYTAKVIQDAGADYLWAEDQSEGSLPLDFETVYVRALDADFWINTGYLNSFKVLLSNDERYGDFKAVVQGNVFCESRRVNVHGGNDIWERGFIHPEEVLADLIKIFHPDLLPEHEFVFYRRLE